MAQTFNAIPCFPLSACYRFFRYKGVYRSPKVCSFRGVHRMETFDSLCVRILPEEEELKISFCYNNQIREFNRKKTDAVSKTLQRISLKLVGKKTKKKKGKNESEFETSLLTAILCEASGESCNTELSNENAFVSSKHLKIGEFVYTITVNPPTVKRFVLPNNIMAGFLVFPEISFEFGSAEYSIFSWYKSLPDRIDWELVGSEMTYTPINDDINHILKLTCKAGSQRESSPILEEFIFPKPVSAGPGVCIFEQRHLYTPKHHSIDSNEFRIVCYNILADMFATSDHARNNLFPYCPEYVLSLNYRKQLIVKELLGYHSDFICLQECGMKLFQSYLTPVLRGFGYEGFFDVKLGAMPEGEALFYRSDRYKHVKDITVSVRDALYMDCNVDILSELTNAPEILESVHKKTAIGQIHVFEEKEGSKRHLCILNTHLYYKRLSQHIRILQMAILLNYLSKNIDVDNTTFIVSGDLNSLRHDTLLKYLSGLQITSEDPVWLSFGLAKDSISMSLKTPIVLRNTSGCPPFTSFVPHCVETLDYIFCDKNLELSAFVPLPSPDNLTPYTGLPCIGSPSDHLALVLDLIWK